jgi:hypothetical protein
MDAPMSDVEDDDDDFSLDLDLDDREETAIERAVRARLSGAAFHSNQMAPLSLGTWSSGINEALHADIRATRYPPIPAEHVCLFGSAGLNTAIEMPHHCSTGATPFAQLPFGLKAGKRKRGDQTHLGAAAAVAPTGAGTSAAAVAAASAAGAAAGADAVNPPIVIEAGGVADGFTWNLLSTGAALALSQAFADHTAARRADRQEGIDAALSLDQWGSFVDGYQPYWQSLAELRGDARAVTDAAVWTAFGRHVLGADRPADPDADVKHVSVLFEHSHSNSFAQIEAMVSDFRRDHAGSPRTAKFALYIGYASLYMICMQFWLFCNNRFLYRTQRDGAAGAVFAADHPAYPFILNCNRDLPTSVGGANLATALMPGWFNARSGESVARLARCSTLNVFVYALMNTPLVHSLAEPGPAQARQVLKFLKNHVNQNREKALTSRKFMGHPMPALLDFINRSYGSVSAAAAVAAAAAGAAPGPPPVIRYKPVQHPSGDQSTPRTLGIEVTVSSMKYVLLQIPFFYSHSFMAPNAPLFSTDGARTQANFVNAVERLDVRFAAQTFPMHRMHAGLQAASGDALLEDCIARRAVFAARIIAWKQHLPFVNKTDTGIFGKCIGRHCERAEFASFKDTDIIVRQQIFTDEWAGQARYTCERLPVARAGVSLASLPRGYDPKMPHASDRYSCYTTRTSNNPSTSMATTKLYQYVREFETVVNSRLATAGDQHVLAMPLDAWLWVAAGVARVEAGPGPGPGPVPILGSKPWSRASVRALVASGQAALHGARYVPCAHRDAWLHFGAAERDAEPAHAAGSDPRVYSLYVYLSFYVGTERDLVRAFLAVLGVCAGDADRVLWAFHALRDSATALFQDTIVGTYDALGAVNPYQVHNSFAHWNNDSAGVATPRQNNVSYVMRKASPPPHRDAYTEFFQFEVTQQPAPGALHRVHAQAYALISGTQLRECDAPDAGWLFRVEPQQALRLKFNVSESFNDMVKSVLGSTRWEPRGGFVVDAVQLAALAVLAFNALVLDTVSVCMDFQLPVSLVRSEAHADRQWFQRVKEADIFSDLDLDAFHANMNRMVDVLAPEVECFLGTLNSMNMNDQGGKRRLRKWAEEHHVLVEVLHRWVTKRGVRDPGAKQIVELHSRMCVVLSSSAERQLALGAPASQAEAPTVDQFIARLRTEIDEHTANVQLFTAAYHQRKLIQLGIATRVIDPPRLSQMLRDILLKMRDESPAVARRFEFYITVTSDASMRALLSRRAPIVHSSLVMHHAPGAARSAAHSKHAHVH